MNKLPERRLVTYRFPFRIGHVLAQRGGGAGPIVPGNSRRRVTRILGYYGPD